MYWHVDDLVVLQGESKNRTLNVSL